MSKSVFRRETCRMCGKSEIELVMHFAPTPPGDIYVPAERLNEVQETYPLDLFLCRACGLVHLPDVVDPQILYGNYIYNTSISLGLVEHFQSYADAVLEQIKPAEGSLVIDIGSNDGTLLKGFQKRGMRVLGIDPAHEIAQKATAAGVETLPAFFSTELARQIKQKYGPTTIVTANNVFANIDDLADLATGIGELLADDGVFVFETGYLVDLIRQSIIDNVYHEHLCYYSVKPLAAFFPRYGLELIEINHVPTKGGSLRGMAQLAGGPRPVSPVITEFIEREVSLGFDQVEMFKAFAAKMDNLRDQLSSLLRDLKAQGKTIAGYGASVGVTTLLHYFGLGDILSFIVDDNPIRHGLFSPGHHIPVLPSEEIYKRQPDYVLILAWRYVEPIMKKHPTYLEQGGHFIVPLPEIKEI